MSNLKAERTDRNQVTQAKRLRVLIYKRTHTGDPTPEGVFGLSDCMGRVRARDYDAVIGVGGLSSEPEACGIAGRVTWVGVGARRSGSMPPGHRGPIVEFDQFKLFDQTGPMLESIAPALAQHLFGVHRRVVMSDGLNATMHLEIAKVLGLVSQSSSQRGHRVSTKPRCPPKRPKVIVCPSPKRRGSCKVRS